MVVITIYTAAITAGGGGQLLSPKGHLEALAKLELGHGGIVYGNINEGPHKRRRSCNYCKCMLRGSYYE